LVAPTIGATLRVSAGPSPRQLGPWGSRAVRRSLDGVDDGLLAIAEEVPTDRIVRAKVGLCAEGTGESALGERAPRDATHALILEERKQLTFVFTHQQVLVLHRDQTDSEG
jgi:hypothetical protein